MTDTEGLSHGVTEARRRLDAHVREMVAWHFSPETGSPFWLEYAQRLDFDPLKDVQGYDDLKRFGCADDLPQEDELLGLGDSHHSRKTLGSTRPGHDTEAHLWQAELRAHVGYPQVAAEGQFQAPAESGPV